MLRLFVEPLLHVIDIFIGFHAFREEEAQYEFCLARIDFYAFAQVLQEFVVLAQVMTAQRHVGIAIVALSGRRCLFHYLKEFLEHGMKYTKSAICAVRNNKQRTPLFRTGF